MNIERTIERHGKPVGGQVDTGMGLEMERRAPDVDEAV